MEADRWQRIEDLFHAAAGQEKGQRDSLLEHACADDESLRWEVASLLAHADQASSFLEVPAVALQNGRSDSLWPASASPKPKVQVGLQSGPTISIAQLTGSFPQTPRFALRHCLGAGGFGIVYEAYDRELNAVVALKTLRRGGPESYYGFKQEFRALGDIVHPNLVALYEFIVEGGQCFFTMELVRGVHLLHYVRSSDPPKVPAAHPDFDRLRACLANWPKE